MRLLLDTHSLVWSLSEPKQLSANARALISDIQNEIFVSYVSLWELTIKISKGKLVVPGYTLKRVLQELHDIGFQFLPMKDEHLLALETLPTFPDHKDPFDRILIAQSIVEGIPLVTVDTKISQYPVETIWN